MLTIHKIKEIFAKEQGFDNWDNLVMNYSYDARAIIDHMEIIAERYARQACEEQRRLCAEAAETYWESSKENSYIKKESILNAPSPV